MSRKELGSQGMSGSIFVAQVAWWSDRSFAPPPSSTGPACWCIFT